MSKLGILNAPSLYYHEPPDKIKTLIVNFISTNYCIHEMCSPAALSQQEELNEGCAKPVIYFLQRPESKLIWILHTD